MHQLPFEARVRIAAALVDGVSIRAIHRQFGYHRDTIGRFAIEAGEACARVHDALVRDVQPLFIECDEAWSFVHTKQAHRKPGDPAEWGDQYLFIALDATTKLIISALVGKRNGVTTERFIADLRMRVLGSPQISTDKFPAYPDAIALHFGPDVDFGTVEKQYAHPSSPEASRRYAPSTVRSVKRESVSGLPNMDRVSTSYVERSNLSLRTHLRRFTRLALGFSKQLRNLEAAVALYIAWYNWCRVHETLRVTPAMEARVTDHVWSLPELLDTALYHCPTPPPVPAVPRGMSAARAKGATHPAFGRLHILRGGRR